MSLPNSIQNLIQQIDHNLTQTEQRAYQGINLVRPLLEQFPENFILMRHFAYFNNVVLFIGIAQNKTRSIVDICTQEYIRSSRITETFADHKDYTIATNEINIRMCHSTLPTEGRQSHSNQ